MFQAAASTADVLCACGCGRALVQPGRTFIRWHHFRQGGFKGRQQTDEHRRKIGEANRRRQRENPQTRELAVESLKKARAARTANAKYLDESHSVRSRRLRYGLTQEQFAALLDAQDNKCGVCQKPLEDRRGKMAVDHDHQTGAVRGLLCNHCNGALGWFERHAAQAHKYLADCK